MKKLTLNTINIETVKTLTSKCDFCDNCGLDTGEIEEMVKSPFPYKYKNESKIEQTFTALICFDCIKQLAKLLNK